MPDVLDPRGWERVLEVIEETLPTLDTSACDAFLRRLPPLPLQIADWAIRRWRDESALEDVEAWLAFLARTGLSEDVALNLGLDPQSRMRFETEGRLARHVPDSLQALAGALDDAEFCGALSGSRGEKSNASLTFGNMLAVMKKPVYATPGLRQIDRRVLLAYVPRARAALVQRLLELFATEFWQSLPSDDVERWSKLNGHSGFLYEQTRGGWRGLTGRRVIDFWIRIATSSRSLAEQRALFETTLDFSTGREPKAGPVSFCHEVQEELAAVKRR